jgi:hypothetical protein
MMATSCVWCEIPTLAAFVRKCLKAREDLCLGGIGRRGNVGMFYISPIVREWARQHLPEIESSRSRLSPSICNKDIKLHKKFPDYWPGLCSLREEH